MKVSTKWLQDYVDLKIDPAQLAEKIERTAVEVDEEYCLADGLKKIVVGYVQSKKPHPDSDHLNICQVDVGQEKSLQIICGAPNLEADRKVIVALPGSRIAGNVKIKRSKMRGEVSEGMICSLQEIGFAESVVPKEFANGIYFLPNNAQPGDSIYSYLGMDEAIIDLDVTPNRADMLSMRGTATELAAIYDKPVHFSHPQVTETADEKTSDLLQVTADSTLAPTYLIRIIKNVTLKASPLWLQKRLWNAGVRPINNVVDVTNYILLDYGQPLHSFDYDQIAGKHLNVRLAHDGETLQTLDEQERQLRPGKDIVIADQQGAAALAGTMGGLRTAVSDQTTTIALEAAVFDATRIRQTARRHKLHSEASTRFERGINQKTVAEALDAAAMLIAELGDGQLTKGILKAALAEPQDVTVKISLDKINQVLGTNLSVATVEDIFQRLGFQVTVTATDFTVVIPPSRWDISIPADLIEEVARIYGYDNLPATLPTSVLTPGHYTYQQRVIRQTRQLLESAGLDQAISYGLTNNKKAQRFMMEPSAATELSFPMSSDRTTARMNLISGLLDDVAYNVARKVENVALYEEGRVFYRQADQVRPREVEHVAGALTGEFTPSNWHEPSNGIDFFTTKGIVEFLLKSLGISQARFVRGDSHEEMHPGRTADIYLGEQFIGFVGEVHPAICQEYRIKRTYVFELDLQQIIEAPKQAELYHPISKYPAITRDVALAVDQTIENAAIINCFYDHGGKYLRSVQLFDVYQGKKMAANKKSLAYKLTYQAQDATLADEQVNQDFERVLGRLEAEFGAVVR